MALRRLRPGLWHWTTYHREWKEEVGSVAFEAADDLVLIDPLVGDDRELDSLVRSVGKPVAILVTVYWHTRNAGALAHLHGARVFAPSRAAAAVRRRAGTVEPFRPGDALPGGVEALATARSSEVVYWIAEHRSLVPGDVILGADGGGLRLCPQSWLPGTVKLRELAASLRPALALPVTRVLVSHGEPVLRGGRAALERIL